VSLTIKPGNFKIKVRRRPGSNLVAALGGVSARPKQGETNKTASNSVVSKQETKPMTILYGSNAGTCKSYAEELESNALRFGFKATVGTLDSATENIPQDQPLVIVAPSYEGKPADNAKRFCEWLQTHATSEQFKRVSYAIFGVGNSDWAQTFHRVPNLIDEFFEKNGGVRFTKTGFVDVKYDIMGPWEEWTETMWKDLRQSSGTTTAVLGGELKAEVTPPKFVSHLGGGDLGYGVVKVNKDIGGAEVGLPKKHMEVELPPGTAYRSGDYLVVLPLNDLETTKRVLRRFNISPDDDITITGTNKAFLATDAPTSVFDLLITRVELGTPVSQKQIKALIAVTPEEKREKLQVLIPDDVYTTEVLGKRFTILDLLEDNPDTQLPFEQYLDMLKPLTPRQYSISSSPIANMDFFPGSNGTTEQRYTASITYDVHDEPSLSGHGQFHGVASTYLARQTPGEKIRCHTRATNVNFHLPLDHGTPIIMVCAGSGLAPMRGFIQERATIKAARKIQLGPAILYFGCRDYEKDFIYSNELRQWEEEGVVSVRPCFSKRGPEDGKVHRYVPERMWEERGELAGLFGDGKSKIYVCGSAAKLGKSTDEVCKKIFMERNGKGEVEAQEWLNKVKEDRYVSDTFE
jgi:cytochrome P450/NADPH-cytochrome P450 reductase